MSATQINCVKLTESAKALGMRDGELSLEQVADIANQMQIEFDNTQVRVAYARAASYCFGEYVANAEESPDLRSYAKRLAFGYTKDFLKDIL